LRKRKGGFADYPTIPDGEHLDLVEREDQITFELGLDDEGLKDEEELDAFRYDNEYDEKEEERKNIKAEILGEDSNDESGSGGDSESGSESEDEEEVPDEERTGPSGDSKKTVVIKDLTETDLDHLRRTIYLTIMSSATFKECTHKLAKMGIPPGRECELINMITECCSQERTFLRHYGLVSGRFCLLHERWQIHRLETNKLRNVAKLFGHLLHTDSFSWAVLGCIHLNEDETTSSSRNDDGEEARR
jgi:pre-mRNA-splicing factor CWC22